jgi:hypothetical protein
MLPLPLTPLTPVLHALSLYSLKVTDPLGLLPPLSVAVSPTVSCRPTVPLVGLACVVMFGLALPTVTCSASQPLLAAALLSSPL